MNIPISQSPFNSIDVYKKQDSSTEEKGTKKAFKTDQERIDFYKKRRGESTEGTSTTSANLNTEIQIKESTDTKPLGHQILENQPEPVAPKHGKDLLHNTTGTPPKQHETEVTTTISEKTLLIDNHSVSKHDVESPDNKTINGKGWSLKTHAKAINQKSNPKEGGMFGAVLNNPKLWKDFSNYCIDDQATPENIDCYEKLKKGEELHSSGASKKELLAFYNKTYEEHILPNSSNEVNLNNPDRLAFKQKLDDLSKQETISAKDITSLNNVILGGVRANLSEQLNNYMTKLKEDGKNKDSKTSTDSFVKLGIIYENSGNPAGAINNYKAAIKKGSLVAIPKLAIAVAKWINKVVIEPKLTTVALGKQLNQLQSRVESGDTEASEKLADLKNHIKTVSTLDKLSIVFTLGLNKINIIRQKILTGLIRINPHRYSPLL